MSLSFRPVLVALALTAGLALAGCSSTAPETTTEGGGGSPAATGNYCADLQANGGSGASISPLQFWLPKEEVVAEITTQQEVMGDIVPPAEIAEEWAAQQDYLDEMLVPLGTLAAGESLSAINELPEDPESYKAITDYFFDTCR